MTTAEVGRTLDAAARAVADAATGAACLDAEERTALLATIDAVTGRLATARADLLTAQRESGAWRATGDPTFEAWRSRTARTGIRAATAEARRGDALASMPAVRADVEAGRLTVEHVDVLARTAATASAPVKAALSSPEGQAELLGLARRVDAGRFAKATARWAAMLDRAALERSHQAQRAARHLHLAETSGGTRLTGLLDGVAGHKLRLALEAAAGRPAPDDERSSEQRRADALVALAEAALAAPPDGAPVGPRASVTFVMREETWASLRAAAGDRAGETPASGDSPGTSASEGPPSTRPSGSPPSTRPSGSPPSTRPSGSPPSTRPNGSPPSTPTSGSPTSALTSAPPACLDDGTPLPPSAVAALLCDCELTRVVLDAHGQPMDLGRTARLHTPAQRRGITVRDEGCYWPGCGAPVRWCEVHHLAWWDRDDGPTSVLDGALACSFHHHELHRRDLVITRYLVPVGATGTDDVRVRYAVATPTGTVLADGRPADGSGNPIGAAVRRWVPGRGAVDLTGADAGPRRGGRSPVGWGPPPTGRRSRAGTPSGGTRRGGNSGSGTPRGRPPGRTTRVRGAPDGVPPDGGVPGDMRPRPRTDVGTR